MKKIKIFTMFLLAISVLFAAGKKDKGNLGFSQGDVEFAVGFLAGWDKNLGIPLVLDVGAINGMLSFGGEARFWWNNYYDYVWNDKDERLVLFGWSPSFRAMFHPFGIPALYGNVKVAKVFDPYAGLKFGASIINYDKDDPWRLTKKSRRIVDFPVFSPTMGLRWYFREKVSLWTEFARYDFSLGFSFKF